MNRDAVDRALSLAGNLPITDDDKKYHNLVYVFCRSLYLPVLFTSLTEIDWRCARRNTPLTETDKDEFREPGKYYYDMPADCIRPLYVDQNRTNFRADREFLVSDQPAAMLFYVFHNRKFDGMHIPLRAWNNTGENSYLLRVTESAHRTALKMTAEALPSPEDGAEEEDFPEWEYTAYDHDFWEYFSYKLAAALVPKLRMDDGASQRAQALDQLAAQKGDAAKQRAIDAATNPISGGRWWADELGLRTHYGQNPPSFTRRI